MVGFVDRLIFFPPSSSYDEHAPGLLRLQSEARDEIAAFHHETPGAGITVLFAHGNAEDLGHGTGHAERYAQLGVSVLSFEYPGYGLSSGKPTEPGTYAAADAAYRYLREQVGLESGAIIAHGRSLGGGVMVDLASRLPVGGLIIESSFVSVYRVVTRAPLLPVDQFKSLAKLSDVAAPALVIHGQRDEVIAPWHGRRLFQALPESRRSSLWVERAGHNDLAQVAGQSYWDALAAFTASVDDALRATS
ncbi:MAG: alpha/beta hydrolase [Gemmatimonadota bacterium]|jgi:fermentation-respiration switch protein FrsA (DUF1100 family)|nr:alpha/beta hydrolase [Gemmatimonadota bacterium]|tara:strand:- start:6683 stop:7426 length:744 start_codon:yes stop_codon:yes gene_type:complete